VRVGVDGRSLLARQRGVARYLGCLLAELARAHPEDEYTVLAPGVGEPATGRPAAPNLHLRATWVPSRPLFASAALAGRPRLDRMLGGCDVAWAPAPAPLAVSPEVPFVLTVHDLSFEHRPGDLSRYERAWHRIARPRRLARRAARIITVSEAVRAEVVAEWGVDPARVVAVLSGPGRARPGPDRVPVGPGRVPAGPGKASRSPQPYLLAVGALEPRKGPDLLAEAHARARAHGLRAELVFAGEGPLRRRLKAAGATVLGHVSDEELEPLYAGALALVCASREEGFAFTPLEAAARGTPAVVFDLPVFAETLGAGALRVTPGDTRALAAALLRIERDERLRFELARAAGAALAERSWERAARRTREVLHEAARAGGSCAAAASPR